MVQKLFVYGTLAPGRPNEHVLKKIGGSWEKGSIKGKLYQAGWGAAMGYPGLKLDQQGEIIEGFVFSSDHLTKHWCELDDFEGEGYKRVLTTITLKDKVTTVTAYVYVLSDDEK